MDRRDWIEKRKHIEDRESKERAIVEKLLPFLEGKIVAGYMPILGEVDVTRFLGERIQYLPKTDPRSNRIRFEKFDHETKLEKGHFNVMEPPIDPLSDPSQIDVILVPLVAFSNTNRLGYGKGYYDRYLKTSKALHIGLAFEEQEGEFMIQPWDVALDYIITDKRILAKKRGDNYECCYK
ncbi:5-formyltetrahydrofolate cyclo-ligase [Dubosiella newyorkensis]|uniref:5-formyltetrahydrofolate cyclo-ligase n=1 Tax=Dubosiella newyorkensis TaxID=1862672 RepID=UPI0025B75B69|nr:5-formyltetrahydrofolate cyclo-ligase [Dubosiella newyorkensis]